MMNSRLAQRFGGSSVEVVQCLPTKRVVACQSAVVLGLTGPSSVALVSVVASRSLLTEAVGSRS